MQESTLLLLEIPSLQYNTPKRSAEVSNYTSQESVLQQAFHYEK